MKKFILASLALCLTATIGYSKKVESPTNSTIKSQKSLEGDKVNVETMQLTGLEMSEALNEDGTDLVKRPYKWYAGIGVADNKQMAIELAQREAYATLSRMIENAVIDGADRGNVAVDGKVRQALTSHWEQVSQAIMKGCEPYGTTSVEYNKNTDRYTAVSKIAIRGDRFTKLLNEAVEYQPKDLQGDELKEFIDTNKAIMEAAKGN